ncbi:NAD(P)-dependent oxidoreductase [Martelella soudanensis]|uniref:NAD(P)-dependent oxidoreductase n=1 Tax=unclassified Martelella TaxID=2629616 RepID=UPI0015DDDC5C|nr:MULTISPECIES: NAD(P)-dependent oxidoreductase [unclassified Martelella]
MHTVAIVTMGQMGSAVAARLVHHGLRVITCLDGRSADSLARAGAAGVTVTSLDRLVGEAGLVLSIVPPHAARQTAETLLPLLGERPEPPLYVDCNAVSPATLHEICALFDNLGLPFADAGIIGASPLPDRGAGPRVYMSGPVGTSVEWLGAHGLDTRLLSDRQGDASALKMAYAGITKGFQALATAMAEGAGRNGQLEALKAEVETSLPDIYKWLAAQLPNMPAKAYRWDGEMAEIARFLDAEDDVASMFEGASRFYRRVARDNAENGPLIETIARFVGR